MIIRLLPYAFILFATVVIPFEFCIKRNLNVRNVAAKDLWIQDREDLFRKAALKDNSYEIVIGGDSVARFGISASTIEKISRKSVLNLSLTGQDTIFTQYCLLDTYFKSVSVFPKYLLLMYHPANFGLKELPVNYQSNLALWCPTIALRSFGIAESIRSIIPSFVYRETIRSWFNHSKFSFEAPVATYTVAKKAPEQIFSEALPIGITSKELPIPTPEEWSLNFFKDIVQLAKKHETKIYMLNPPGTTEKGEAVLKEIANITGIDLISPIDDASPKIFSDGAHLNNEGARLISESLGQFLK